MRFRPATLEDVSSLLALQEEFYASEGYPFERDAKERAMRELVANPVFGRLFVIGDFAGYLVVTFGFSLEFGGRDAFIDELYVVASSRGQGFGSEALTIAERACVEEGIHALHLEVEFANERARALYARSGYSAHERHLMTKRFD